MNKANLFVFIVLTVFFSACGSVKIDELQMMSDVDNSLIPYNDFPPLVIQSDDILSVVVRSEKPANIQPFVSARNELIDDSQGPASIGKENGYRVDSEGMIYLPFVGGVLAQGKTTTELQQELNAALKAFINDIAVQVNFINFKVTVLGEVNRPNAYSVKNERLTLLEAIGMAGDFTSYASRSNVLIVRERNDEQQFIRINTQNKDLFQSEYYYLQPNDLVYIEPLKAKQYATSGGFIERYGFFFVSLATLIASVWPRN